MTTRPTFATIEMRPDSNGQADLVLTPTGSGGGRVSFDRSLTSPLLIALGSDRWAERDDALPALMTGLDGTAVPLGARRGWVGDVLLSDGQRHGSRLWLLERAKRTETTRLAAEDYAQEAISAIEGYHGVELNVSAAWQNGTQRGVQGVLSVTVSGAGAQVSQKVPTL